MTETKAAHTPGPWEAVRTTPSGVKFDVHHKSEGCDGGYFASVEAMHSTDEALRTCAANARLIAAAPELLDTLILALPYVEMAEHDDGYKPGAVAKMISQMRSAIAKAEGR